MSKHNYNSTLFLTLCVFSAVGGIEKVNRVLGKALDDLGLETGQRAKIFSMYDNDEQVDEKYFPRYMFRGYNGQRLKYFIEAVRQGKKSDVVIMSHINLLSIGYLIKVLSPKTKVILITHGIEVWKSFSDTRNLMMDKCDYFVPVSQYTRDKMIELNGYPKEKFRVLNNCLDPFLPLPETEGKSEELLKKYGFTKDDKILMTLTRLSSKERYKGYDFVLETVKELKPEFPNLKYLVIGKYDKECKSRLDEKVESLGIKDSVCFTGFIPDNEISRHFNLADIYVMPSKKEGFGIVFIEAMYYGKPVIAGNKDGSVDALKGGDFGLLVNPESGEDITRAVREVMAHPDKYIPRHEKVMEAFSFETYKKNLYHLLQDIKKD